MKNSSNTIGNRTRDLPVCSAVPSTSCATAYPYLWNGAGLYLFSAYAGLNTAHTLKTLYIELNADPSKPGTVTGVMGEVGGNKQTDIVFVQKRLD